MATSLKTLAAQVAELTALVTILATQGASVTVTEQKPAAAKKSRKTKAKTREPYSFDDLAWYYGAGKEKKREYRDALKDALREAGFEADGDFQAWTFAQLTECCIDNDVSMNRLDG